MYLCTSGVFGGFWRRVLETVFTSAENFSRRVLETRFTSVENFSGGDGGRKLNWQSKLAGGCQFNFRRSAISAGIK